MKFARNYVIKSLHKCKHTELSKWVWMWQIFYEENATATFENERLLIYSKHSKSYIKAKQPHNQQSTMTDSETILLYIYRWMTHEFFILVTSMSASKSRRGCGFVCKFETFRNQVSALITLSHMLHAFFSQSIVQPLVKHPLEYAHIFECNTKKKSSNHHKLNNSKYGQKWALQEHDEILKAKSKWDNFYMNK